MTRGFWDGLKKPFFVLAPLANVTDEAFRRLFAKYSKPDGPDAMWTEFVSVEALLSEGRKKVLPDLWYSEAERPVVAQIFGSKPEQFERVARQLVEMGFDGIDINMGCPDKGVEKSGGGAAMIKNPKVAQAVVLAAKRGAGKIPVSVKTRLGYNKNEMTEWVKHLLEVEPAAITMHLRTRKEMSRVPAHWDQMKKMVELVAEEIPKAGERPYLLGNGDIDSLAEAEKKVKETGADGVMIGRGIFGNPFFFNRKKEMKDLSVKERLKVMIEHTRLFEEIYLVGSKKSPRGNTSGHAPGRSGRVFKAQNHCPLGSSLEYSIKRFDVMKKHFKAYVNGFDGAKELRIELMEAGSADEVGEVVKHFLTHGRGLKSI